MRVPSARLAIATGRDLAQACRDAFPKFISFPLWIFAELAICATDLAEVIGTAIGLNLLFKIPLEFGVLITALDVFLILWLQNKGFRWIEAFVISLLVVITTCFAIQIFYAKPEWAEVMNGFIPTTDIITNPIASNINLLSLPGQREPFVTDYASDRASGFGLALYLMDIPNYNSSGDRIFDGEILGTSSFIDVQQTANNFDIRSIDNTFVSAYFPDVIIADPQTNKRITVPATVAALAAIGYNDKVAYPWFAPAGFNRAALNFVTLTRTRVNQGEREKLYQVRINPIVKFPNEGYVIFAQKTLDGAGTSLDSINVQRMIMDVQRQVIDIGNKLIWQQLTPALYNEFISRVTPILSLVQNRGGLRQFKVVCDNTNNTMLDRENNKMNAKIYLLPVKAVEFIALDFIVTREGVQFG